MVNRAAANIGDNGASTTISIEPALNSVRRQDVSIREGSLHFHFLQRHHYLHRNDQTLVQAVGTHAVNRLVAQAAAIPTYIAARLRREVQLGVTSRRGLPVQFPLALLYTFEHYDSTTSTAVRVAVWVGECGRPVSDAITGCCVTAAEWVGFINHTAIRPINRCVLSCGV